VIIMRKLILASALVAALLPAAAMAQSIGEVRHDKREIRQDRHDLRKAQWRGNRHDVRDARRDLRDDRQERRGDWQDFRRAHPETYRIGGYAGPRAGWAYRPVTAGYRFDPSFYGQRYWIDPVHFHLRPVGTDLRWVRYGNDVLLVNIRTGRVIEVNNGFFY
jgi:Ni/Co efflux regulator RcnB